MAGFGLEAPAAGNPAGSNAALLRLCELSKKRSEPGALHTARDYGSRGHAKQGVFREKTPGGQMKYGRINFSGDADAFDREPKLMSERRHRFRVGLPINPEPKRAEKLCSECNRIQPVKLFEGGFATCKDCRERERARKERYGA